MVDEASTALRVLVGVFLLLEAANVVALYLRPGSRRFNAVGVFDGWQASQSDPDLHDFVRYLVFWVAGTKVIFIALWLVILATAEPRTQVLASAVMIPAIATFYWRLNPIARDLDRRGKLQPKGYSRTLAVMIAGILAAFAGATLLAL
jgi:hypothetical protein